MTKEEKRITLFKKFYLKSFLEYFSLQIISKEILSDVLGRIFFLKGYENLINLLFSINQRQSGSRSKLSRGECSRPM